MARSVIRLDEKEREIFHANYCYMWKKLNTAPYYVCGYGEEPEWINASWLLPSYANLSKCLNPSFAPSMNIVNKIVQFYNANVSPSTDTYQFLHTRLEDTDHKRGLGDSNKINELTGLYYGYYYAGIEDEKQIYGSLLKIYDDGNSVSACMIAGLTDNDIMQSQTVRDIIDEKDVSLEKYRDFKHGLPLQKRRTSIYEGPVVYSPGLMTLSLKDVDHEKNTLHLRIPTGPSIDGKYIGSLALITMFSDNFDFQFLKIGIERADIDDLSVLSLEDEKLLELLKIKKADNEHIYLPRMDNTRWLDYLLATK